MGLGQGRDSLAKPSSWGLEAGASSPAVSCLLFIRFCCVHTSLQLALAPASLSGRSRVLNRSEEKNGDPWPLLP